MNARKRKLRNIVSDLLRGVCFSESVPVLVKYLASFDSAGVDFLVLTTKEDLIRIAESKRYDLILCVPPVNDFVEINDLLWQIREKLKPGGMLMGRVKTLETKKISVLGRRSPAIYGIIFLYDFVFRRVLPTLLGLIHIVRKVGLTRHRIMSKCEALGRLRYCGYEILHLQESAGHLCFVTRPGTALMNGDPCEGVFIKIRKQGLNGRNFFCYKLRTMHPYANYLHDYVLDNLEIDNNGKIVGDFRVPIWGKILRKLWLDEMPQLFNILKGELTFIGLRHLSQEFLELYPDDWRKERMKIRPGFVPPYYADCPKTFEGIIESEKRYYRLRKKHPITTDIYYFMRVVINFLTLRARTG